MSKKLVRHWFWESYSFEWVSKQEGNFQGKLTVHPPLWMFWAASTTERVVSNYGYVWHAEHTGYLNRFPLGDRNQFLMKQYMNLSSRSLPSFDF